MEGSRDLSVAPHVHVSRLRKLPHQKFPYITDISNYRLISTDCDVYIDDDSKGASLLCKYRADVAEVSAMQAEFIRRSAACRKVAPRAPRPAVFPDQSYPDSFALGCKKPFVQGRPSLLIAWHWNDKLHRVHDCYLDMIELFPVRVFPLNLLCANFFSRLCGTSTLPHAPMPQSSRTTPPWVPPVLFRLRGGHLRWLMV